MPCFSCFPIILFFFISIFSFSLDSIESTCRWSDDWIPICFSVRLLSIKLGLFSLEWLSFGLLSCTVVSTLWLHFMLVLGIFCQSNSLIKSLRDLWLLTLLFSEIFSSVDFFLISFSTCFILLASLYVALLEGFFPVLERGNSWELWNLKTVFFFLFVIAAEECFTEESFANCFKCCLPIFLTPLDLS